MFLLETHIGITPLSLQYVIPLSDRMLWYSIHLLNVLDKNVLRRKFTTVTGYFKQYCGILYSKYSMIAEV